MRYHWKQTGGYGDAIYISSLAIALLVHISSVISHEISEPLLTALAFIGIIPVGRSAIRGMRDRRITVDLLASIALLFSFIAQEWVSAAFINLMLASARYFHHITESRGKRSIERLISLQPRTTLVQREEVLVPVPIEEVRRGDSVVVRAGDRIPVDGIIVSGQASIDEATLTGESEPVTKQVGDTTYSATTVVSGTVTIRADKVGEETTLAHIIRLVSAGTRAKSPIERIGDRFASWYITISLIVAIVLWFATGDARLVLALLLVVCADDIAVANPLAFTVALAKSAARGTIIKGSESIERMVKLRTFITDKTGTLTEGRPRVEHIEYFSGYNQRQVWELLAAAEASSHHPIAHAIMDFISAQGIQTIAADEHHEYPGEGIMVVEGGIRAYVGKRAFIESRGIPLQGDVRTKYEALVNEGKTVIVCATDTEILALIALADSIRPDAVRAVQALTSAGAARLLLLSGDHTVAAARVAQAVGIDQFEAEVSPQDKLARILAYRDSFGPVGMIGDGVNDAAALAAADVGFAMGVSGSDVSIESADVTLMRDELIRVPESLLLAKRTMRTIHWNFVIWGITNVAGLFLVFGGILGPSGAAAYNFVTDLITVGNSLFLFSYRVSID